MEKESASSDSFEPPFRKLNELQRERPTLPVYLPNFHIQPHDQLDQYLDHELRTPGLDKIWSYLWLAGLPSAARPLHRQKLVGRRIVITENPAEHLVWHMTRIFVKPLPEYLICYDFWKENADLFTRDPSLRQCANGFLLSYCWIICSKSDLDIAHDTRLIPDFITWEDWTAFAADFLQHVDAESLCDVSMRYHYGELRLSRLNLIYRFAPAVFSTHRLIRGFMSESTWSKAFLERNFAWLFPIFALISIITNAMQVGLGTDWLRGSDAFQTVSVVFTGASMIGVATSVIGISILWAFLFCYHVMWARRNLLEVRRKRASAKGI